MPYSVVISLADVLSSFPGSRKPVLKVLIVSCPCPGNFTPAVSTVHSGKNNPSADNTVSVGMHKDFIDSLLKHFSYNDIGNGSFIYRVTCLL